MIFDAPVPDHVQLIPPYVAGRPIASVAREFGLDEATIVKLASNENPLGMSPLARRAIAALAEDPARYPDPDGYALKQALAARLDVPADYLTLGAGSSELLLVAGHGFLAPGRAAVMAEHSFIVYLQAVTAAGARPVVVPAVDYGHDLDAMLAACTDDVHLVFIGNPNNPTGTFLPKRALTEFIAKVPKRIMIVHDEAYVEYADPEQRVDAIGLAKQHPNLLVLRTFSKIYGLAGLRVGYGISHPSVTAVLNRVRPTFNVSIYAQAAAQAALGDDDFLASSYRTNREGMTMMTEAFARLGIPTIPSQGNFLAAKVGDAAAINLALLKRGIIVRPIADYGMPEYLRVTIGTAAENRTFIDAITEIMRSRQTT
ncbi:MAG: hisC [Rhodospirillales bacterium]|nr:hisC [Rhodospirillales bacterium]